MSSKHGAPLHVTAPLLPIDERPSHNSYVHWATVTVLLITWYTFHWLSNVSMKAWYYNHPESGSLLVLLLVLYVGNLVAFSICLVMMGAFSHSGLQYTLTTTQQMCHQAPYSFAGSCILGVMGTACLWAVLQTGSIGLVQMLRCSGPMFTAVLAYLFLEQKLQRPPIVCLVITLAGTVLATWKEPTFNMLTCLMGIFINFCLSARNTLNKGLFDSVPHDIRPSAGTFILVAANAVATVVVLLTYSVYTVHLGPRATQLLHSMLLTALAQPLTLKTVAFSFVSTLSSQLVLVKLPVVSHGMLELFKRTVLLLLVASAGQLHWGVHNMLGAGLATLGTSLYFYAQWQYPHVKQPVAKWEKITAAALFAVCLLIMAAASVAGGGAVGGDRHHHHHHHHHGKEFVDT